MSEMYKLRAPRPANVYRVFVSSSDEYETQTLRNRIKGLIEEVINPQLQAYPESQVLLALDIWERAAAQRVVDQERVNQIFVEQVRQSSLTIGLLLDEVRPGTEEELVAALSDPQIQVAIHIFDREGQPPATLARSVEDFLEEHGSKLFYVRSGASGSDAAWFTLLRTLLRFAFAAMRENDPRARPPEVEVR